MNTPLNTLSEMELNWLDDFLMNRIGDDEEVGDRDEGIIDLSELDGFFTAIVSGPEMVSPSIWLQSIWGDFEPEWKTQQDAEHAISILIRYMNGNAAFLIRDPQNFEPIFLERTVKGRTYTIVDDWCEGYMRGVELMAVKWQMDVGEMKMFLAPVKAFTMDYGMGIDHELTQQEVEKLQQAITPNVIKIHDYWLERRSHQVPPKSKKPFSYVEKQPGRNDPCPCGSGKKYKKCCLH